MGGSIEGSVDGTDSIDNPQPYTGLDYLKAALIGHAQADALYVNFGSGPDYAIHVADLAVGIVPTPLPGSPTVSGPTPESVTVSGSGVRIRVSPSDTAQYVATVNDGDSFQVAGHYADQDTASGDNYDYARIVGGPYDSKYIARQFLTGASMQPPQVGPAVGETPPIPQPLPPQGGQGSQIPSLTQPLSAATASQVALTPSPSPEGEGSQNPSIPQSISASQTGTVKYVYTPGSVLTVHRA